MSSVRIYPIPKWVQDKIRTVGILAACILLRQEGFAATRIVNSTSNDSNTIGTLPYWILNGNNGDTLDCSSISGQTITLTSSLPAITTSYTINGAGLTINGADSYQAFQVASGTVVINNVNIQHALSKGGDGGSGYSGGGGGVGGGGALYIHTDSTVTLNASSLVNNIAQGGNGGNADNNGNGGGGGGGGFGGGNGGSSLITVSTGGGGGGHSNGGNGGSNASVNGSNGIYFGGGGGGGGINLVTPGGIGGNAAPTSAFQGGNQSSGNGGGGAGDSENGASATGSGSSGVPGEGGHGIGSDLLFGGGGGGGCSSETGFPGGHGIGAGGGGGGYNYGAGTGGVLGGGGGGGASGGNGGFGAGGGGGSNGGIGGGGFNAGGGNGGSDLSNNGAGGGGSGLGGAIFVQSNASLIIVDAVDISGNSAIAGIGGSSTTTDPGYIPAQDGEALGYDIFVREEGSITFNISNTLTIATPIQGDQTSGPNTSGGLEKQGVGTLQLNGANTYSGVTTVDAGTLNLNGSLIGSVIVLAQGSLSGNATIGGTLNNSGILAPGNSIGTISSGPVTLTNTSVYLVEFGTSGSTLLHVTGGVALDGTLEITQNAGSYSPSGEYTLIETTGGFTGAFAATQIHNLIGFELSLQQTDTALLLGYSTIPLSGNASAVANYLNQYAPTSTLDLLNHVEADALPDALNSVSPARNAFVGFANNQNVFSIFHLTSSHLDTLRSMNKTASKNTPVAWLMADASGQISKTQKKDCPYSTWISGFADFSHVSASHQNPSFHFTSGAVLLGFDYRTEASAVIGGSAGYLHTDLKEDENAGDAHINSGFLSFYSDLSYHSWYFQPALLAAYNATANTRHITFPGFSADAHANLSSWQLAPHLEIGYDISKSWGNILPFVACDYAFNWQRGYTETGASPFNATEHAKLSSLLRTEAGIKVIEAIAFPLWTLFVKEKASYIYEKPYGNQVATFLTGLPGTLSVTALNSCLNLGAFGLELFAEIGTAAPWGLELSYDGEFGSSYFSNEVALTLSKSF